ncbi:TrbC family F-type conjugative pilus assembly protein [Piscirickettsia litoralis]|uniref:Conjugal transfer protein TraW n=1 Tax=Piscirickettsia litoralis TaxID=1891921 RepID=A0ABX3A189_9GAMM|nr:TrbC family F-type conjugative pilus assembly protein [Piscirickettsia litoralis]ODN41393.1 hypothetical protein BGC07_16630 [Piscirickettsia litoralis]
MNKLSVVCIRCFSVLALSLHTLYANSLSDQDMKIVQQSQKIMAQAKEKDFADILHPSKMAEEKQEAMQLYHQLSETNPTLKQARQDRQQASYYKLHKILVFASLAMGESGLKALLKRVHTLPQAVVVFRGIPKGMPIMKALIKIQSLGAQLKPVPNIMLDPTLFKTYHVTVAPTMIYLSDQVINPEATRPVYKPLARVEGLSNPHWLINQVKDRHAKDFGQAGETVAISEPDLIDVMKERVMKIDWKQKKEAAIKRFWQKQIFTALPEAHKDKTRIIDPTITVTRNIQAPNGQIIVPAGSSINPLHMRPFDEALVVFNATDQKELACVQQAVQRLRYDPAIKKVILITTQLNRTQGWKDYKQVTNLFEAPIFLLSPDIKNRFQLERTPSIVTAEGDHFIVQELAIKGGPNV